MKIGMSLGRCVRDIVEGNVEYDDILVIITRTACETEEHLEEAIHNYMYEPSYLLGLEYDDCISVAKRLFNDGKLHQPRLLRMRAGHPQRFSNGPASTIWWDAFPSSKMDNETVRKSWENYIISLKMAN